MVLFFKYTSYRSYGGFRLFYLKLRIDFSYYFPDPSVPSNTKTLEATGVSVSLYKHSFKFVFLAKEEALHWEWFWRADKIVVRSDDSSG